MSNLLEQASLVLIPSGYAEDIVYSEIPLDGSGDLSFTRASNGTRINFDGLVEVVPWNLLQNSENFTSNWNPNNNTITANTTTAPNGTTTADTFTLIPSSDSSVYQAVNGESNNYTTSVYAKYVSGDKYLYFFSQLNAQGAKVWFDIQNGTVSNQLSGFTGTIENVGNGWYKCSMYNTTASVSDYIQFGISTTNSSRVLSNNSVAYFWGAQVNLGTAKPYFPTTDRLNVPRLTYQNGGGGCPSLLLEKQSTNLVTYSEDFTNAVWIKTGNNVSSPTVTANQITSPDGTQNADKIVFPSVSNSGDFSLVYRNAEALTGSNTTSVYLKGENGGEKVYLFYIVGSTWSNKLCTLTTEWQRFDLTFTGGSVSFWHLGVDLRSGSGQSAQSAQTIYAWGAQLEASSYPTSYIPTTSASATRVADACFKTGISSLIGQTEGVLFWEGIVLQQTDIVAINRSTANGIYINKGASNLFRAAIYYSSNVIQFADTIVRNTNTKIAIAYKSGDSALFINGAKIGSTNTSSITFNGALSEIRLNDNYLIETAPQFSNNIAVYKQRLTDAECISLTTI
jgi:hypothetical protein